MGKGEDERDDIVPLVSIVSDGDVFAEAQEALRLLMLEAVIDSMVTAPTALELKGGE